MDKIKFGETVELEDGRQYNCFATLQDDGKDYVFLISNFKPQQIKFAEQKIIDGDLQIKIVVEKNLKIYLLNMFQEKYGKAFKN